jgi:hypothetical protein
VGTSAPAAAEAGPPQSAQPAGGGGGAAGAGAADAGAGAGAAAPAVSARGAARELEGLAPAAGAGGGAGGARGEEPRPTCACRVVADEAWTYTWRCAAAAPGKATLAPSTARGERAGAGRGTSAVIALLSS